MAKGKSKLKRFKYLVIAAFLIFYFAIAYRSSSRLLLNLGSSEFETSISSSVYEALSIELLDSTNFSDFFKITYNKDGDITFIATDSFKINMLAYSLAAESHKIYEAHCNKGVEIPIGAFTGINLLSGIGPKTSIKLINVQSVKCIFVSDFKEAGINQTRQTLYLKITTHVTIVAPSKKIDKEASISILAYDNLIVGKVPQIYLTTKTIGG